MDDLLQSLNRFERRFFPRYREHFRLLVKNGQHPRMLFIGCSDSRVVPYLLTGAGPGELFVVRNVGNLVPIWSDEHVGHGTAAAVEYAVAVLGVRDIVVCGHSHCGAIRALYDDHDLALPNLNAWLDFARPAVLPVSVSEEALRRTEQRSVVLQLERLLEYPMVRQGVETGRLFLHGWHYLIEAGKVLVLDVERGSFVEADAVMGVQAPPEGAVYQLQ
ncbi:carbonic anhydrase [uncultured Azonexus sp.]|uniref:carbonic anhydrase n=1 Tax=uncultured Azonexus sp. TaxID=520307 RepID=UPI002628E729|nr:carbonic anhydrase [uncultured Azonexus sp.]